MIASRVDPGAGSDLPLRSVRGRLWTSRCAVGATVALLARGLNAFVARLEMDPGAAVPEHQDADE